ncbi:alpha/beta hydrolase [uncultured Williamsia sp.]|uniref:alpha/beta fold hydrolase n=1 Tax=uncultured Williamsia sp. TaxID=259311 RepID=UPI002616CFAF|nr:alpha/beta hydrolase [uncultured Williamsia sp.]
MQLRHDVIGDGPTLVLVHGVIHRRQAWAPVAELLAPYRRVVVVDLPGHGESDDFDQPGAQRIAMMLDELAAFVREVGDGSGPAHVAGNSLGGYLALCLAARGEVATATAVSPAGFWNTPAEQSRAIARFRALRAAASVMGDRAPTLFRSRAVRYPSLAPFFAHPSRVSYENAVVDVNSLRTNTALDDGIEAEFAFPQATDPSIPVTVAWGTRDLILPNRQRHRVREHFPQARIISVPGVGHVPMTDNPELIASILVAGSTAPTTGPTSDR